MSKKITNSMREAVRRLSDGESLFYYEIMIFLQYGRLYVYDYTMENKLVKRRISPVRVAHYIQMGAN